MQQTIPVAEETSNSMPIIGVPLLATEEEEVISKASGGTFHPSRGEEIVEGRSERVQPR